MPYPDYSSSLNSFGSSDYHEPLSYPSRGGPSGGGDNSWKVSLNLRTNDTVEALVGEGKVVESLHSLKYKTVSETNGIQIPRGSEGVIYLERLLFDDVYGLGDGSNLSLKYESIDLEDNDFQLFLPADAFTAVPPTPLTHTRYPIARIKLLDDPPPFPAIPFEVIQLAGTNLVITAVCIDGAAIPLYRAI